MSTLFEAQAPHPLADRLRPQQPRRDRRPGPSARPRGADRPHGGGAAARLDDPVGPAGLRQDDDRAAAGARHRARLRAAVGGVLRGRRSAQGVRGGAGSAARWARARCCSSTRSTASTAPSRTPFCPVVEDGTVILVGATTENPSFELIGALLSRVPGLRAAPARRRRRSRPCWQRAEAHLGHAAAADRRRPRRAARDGRRRRPLSAEPGRGDRPAAARAGRSDRSSWPSSCSAARRSTTRRRRATTT